MIPISTTVPTRYPAFVTWMLIAVNCAVFLVQINLPPGELDEFIFTYAFIPARESNASTPLDFLPFVTMMFLHDGWLHLILNIWTLYLFGPAVEDRLSHGRYLLFYLGCGVAASFAQMATDPSSTAPVLGASGAIAGVLGCNLRLFPLSRVIVLIPILFLPLFFELYAFVFIGLWFLLQLLQGTAALLHPAEGGVAWWAHVGGFMAGLLFGPLLLQPQRRYRVYHRDEGILGFDAWGRR